VVVDALGNVAGRGLVKSAYRFAKAIEESYIQALANVQIAREEVRYVAATGYGRFMVPFKDIQLTELTCHAWAAFHLFPSTRVILDIGGQDIKAIKIDGQGKVRAFRLNDKCAAGTGAFLERIARYLGKTTDDIALMAQAAHQPVPISSTCAVFAESEVINQLSTGMSAEDIMAGAIQSLAQRAVNLMRPVGLEPSHTLTGGMTKNGFMIQSLENELGDRLNIPPDGLGHLSGALGAALMGLRRIEKLESESH
jgi:predicted CoA-substrate-specific enzyme activase